MSERLIINRALLAASERLGAVVEIVAVASSDDDARRGIRELLGCSPSAAEAVLSAQLRRFRSERLGHLLQETEELERARESATPGAPAADEDF
jgi:DNA gyrase/topoisomerase IV subunit A